MNLRLRVNDELELDAGTTETPSATEIVIHAPNVTLFHQVLTYLRAKSDPAVPAAGPTAEQEGLAAAAVAFRWGSYLAVLADSAKPVWAEARSPETSRIHDTEMARINVEASAALAEWVDVSREDRGVYEKLVGRALAYLPLPKLRPRPQGSKLAILALPDVAAKMTQGTDPDRLGRVRADAESHPSRLFANALVNTAWRNGPIENVHAGTFHGYPLDHRRMTTAEESAVLSFAADSLTTGMEVCQQLTLERPARSWSEQVLPYGLAGTMLITPTGWTLTEATREVRLPRS